MASFFRAIIAVWVLAGPQLAYSFNQEVKKDFDLLVEEWRRDTPEAEFLPRKRWVDEKKITLEFLPHGVRELEEVFDGFVPPCVRKDVACEVKEIGAYG
jgi:hypothetical protein